MPYINLKSGKTYYVAEGDTNGIPVIFIHGFPFDHSMWDEQRELLRGTYCVIVFDVRGHGKSEPGDGHYTIDFFTDDLFDLMDRLEIEKGNIVGLSMGGYIALRGIERSPDRFNSLVLCDTKSEADGNEGKQKRIDAIRTIKYKGINSFAENFLKSVFLEESLKTMPDIVEKIRSIILSTPENVLCSTLIALASRTDTTGSLASVKVPTLILVGENDKVTPPETSRAMAEKIPNAVLKILRNAAHMSNLENPAEFNNQLITFLAKAGNV